jgi:predicted nucleic acid-binding protein
MLESLDEVATWVDLAANEEAAVIAGAPAKGIQGRLIFDALIAAAGRSVKIKAIVTANPSDFRHVSPHTDIIDLTHSK